jgi:predicted MPP superfamily phosphohydrolase
MVILIDLYIWQGIRHIIRDWSNQAQRMVRLGFWGLLLLNLFIIVVMNFFRTAVPEGWMRTLGVFVTIQYIPKLFWVIFLLVDDALRLLRWVFSLFIKAPAAMEGDSGTSNGISRLDFLVKSGFGLAATSLMAGAYGIARGAHDYQIRRLGLPIKDLPPEFEGLKLLQVSDIHSGSFWSREGVLRGIEKIKQEQADLVFFTGDLVNDMASEMEEWKEVFQQITAPLGVYSVLGNHDYGDYVAWPSAEAKAANLERLKQLQKEMGWNLLLNENQIIEKNGQKLAIIGVENWSAKGRFPKYGRLDEAVRGTENISAKLLLSHDPSHWKAEILEKFPDIQATFSGHTHGFQFGIETAKLRWSPAKYMYPEWAGLYNQGDQHLYVNRGFGYLGYPGRLGIRPEITVFTLQGV